MKYLYLNHKISNHEISIYEIFNHEISIYKISNHEISIYKISNYEISAYKISNHEIFNHVISIHSWVGSVPGWVKVTLPYCVRSARITCNFCKRLQEKLFRQGEKISSRKHRDEILSKYVSF